MDSSKFIDAADVTTDHYEKQKKSLGVNNLSATDKANEYATDGEITIDDATNRRIFWKISRRILVVQIVTYFCQSLDKGIVNYASIMGIRSDAHLKGQEVRLYITVMNLNY